MRFLILLMMAIIVTSHSNATDRFFPDITAESPNGVWRLDAKSPDNLVAGYHPWQDDFVYTMHKDGIPLWTREQNSQQPREHSPSSIVVGDDGWTAIHTGRNELIFVNAQGRTCGRIDDLTSLLTEKDIDEFATWTTAGLIWTPYSLWHFATVDEKRIFVIRLWWGNQLIFDPESGRRLSLSLTSAKAIRKEQVEHCLKLLTNAVAEEIDDDSASELLEVALLAGQLKIREAIPHLRKLQESEFIGLSGGQMDRDLAPGEIHPFFIQKFTLRQISQLSLRRLGEVPKPLPVYEFPKYRIGGNFRPESRSERDKLIASIKPGMSAIEVLEILGSPDFVEYPEWSYDLDGSVPRTATISWESKRVKNLSLTNPLWLDAQTRDRMVVGF